LVRPDSDLPPGPLTRLRAANVDKEKLARVAVDHGIHRFLRHKAPQLDGQVTLTAPAAPFLVLVMLAA
jgi:dsRNA-specific ribonuclease